MLIAAYFCISAIVTNSEDTRILNNMVALVVWTGSYQDRFQPFNFRWEAGVEAIEANNLTLQDNVVVGSERFGFHVSPLECDDTSGRYRNNMAYSNLIGYGVLPGDVLGGDCVMVSGFILWKSHDWGIYYQNAPGLKIDGNTLVENRQGIWTSVLGPSPVDHLIGDKIVEISNTIIVGASSSFDCAKDVSPVNDNMRLSSLARPKMAPTGGMIGLVFPNFMAKTNEAPTMKFGDVMSYNSIYGLMKLTSKLFFDFITLSR